MLFYVFCLHLTHSLIIILFKTRIKNCTRGIEIGIFAVNSYSYFFPFLQRPRPTISHLFTGEIKCSTHRTRIPRKKRNALATTLAAGSIQLVTEKHNQNLK